MLKGFLNFCGFLGLLSIVAYIFSVAVNIFKSLFKKNKNNKFTDIFLNPIFSYKNTIEESVTKENGGMIVVYTIYIITILSIIWAPLSFFYKEEKIGSIFEKAEYTTQYYVNLFPKNSDSKNYRVKADIYSVVSENSYTDGDSEKVAYNREYYIERAYFPNGGSVSFEDNVGSGESLVLNKKEYLVDDDGEEWYVELTNVKVK